MAFFGNRQIWCAVLGVFLAKSKKKQMLTKLTYRFVDKKA